MTRIALLMNQYKPGEKEKRESAVRAAASPSVEIGFIEMVGSPGGGAVTDFHRSMVAPLVARSAMAAQTAGYDAVVTWGTLDLGVEEARHVVDIPVIGPGRTVSFAAATLVERFGVICYGAPQIRMFAKLTRAWRVDDRVVGIRSVGLPQQAITSSPDQVFAGFVEEGRAMAEIGAEAIVPLGLSMVPVTLAARALADAIGLPVLDPLAISLRLAEALAVTGVTNSRAAYPAASLD